MSNEVIGVLVLGWIITGIICGSLSQTVVASKGYTGSGWFFAGFFFGILGLIAAAGLGPNRQVSIPERQSVANENTLPDTAPVTISHEKKIANRVIFVVLMVIVAGLLLFALNLLP